MLTAVAAGIGVLLVVLSEPRPPRGAAAPTRPRRSGPGRRGRSPPASCWPTRSGSPWPARRTWPGPSGAPRLHQLRRHQPPGLPPPVGPRRHWPPALGPPVRRVPGADPVPPVLRAGPGRRSSSSAWWCGAGTVRLWLFAAVGRRQRAPVLRPRSTTRWTPVAPLRLAPPDGQHHPEPLPPHHLLWPPRSCSDWSSTTPTPPVGDRVRRRAGRVPAARAAPDPGRPWWPPWSHSSPWCRSPGTAPAASRSPSSRWCSRRGSGPWRPT